MSLTYLYSNRMPKDIPFFSGPHAPTISDDIISHPEDELSGVEVIVTTDPPENSYPDELAIQQCLAREEGKRSRFLKYVLEEMIPAEERKFKTLTGSTTVWNSSNNRKSDVRGALDSVKVEWAKCLVLERMPLSTAESDTPVTQKAVHKRLDEQR